MPRKKQSKSTIELEDEVEKEIPIEDGDDDIQEALKSVPGGITTVKLYRILPQGGRPKFLTEMSPEMFSESSVQDTYGGGIYKIRAKKKDGRWGWNTFEIDGPMKKVQAYDEDPEEEAPEPTVPAHSPNLIQQTQPVIDPFMLMNMMQKAEERGEQRMLKMLEIMRPQQQSPDMTKQVFEIVEKIAPMMAGGEGGGSPWMMALTQFREPLLKIVDSVHVALTRQPASPTQPHTAIPNPPNHPSQSAQPEEGDMIKFLIKQYLPVFVNAARMNGNTDIYAEMILEQLPESMYPKIEEWLSKPTWFDDVKSFDPVVLEKQATWWAMLRTSLLEGLKPDASSLQHTSDTEHSED